MEICGKAENMDNNPNECRCRKERQDMDKSDGLETVGQGSQIQIIHGQNR